jgi:predicted amidohydrolase YtcJ
MNTRLFYLLSFLIFFSCKAKITVDAIFFNGKIYTLQGDNEIAEAMVVRDGKVVATGKDKMVLRDYSAKSKIDLGGKSVYPGFIDAHCHFYGYGMNLSMVDLTGTTSWDEAMQRVKEHAASPGDDWITGRGWDQNDWAKKDFPNNEQLNVLFPDRPVFLKRIDGHAAVANQKALDIAGIDEHTSIAVAPY